MARFYGAIGYSILEDTASGVWGNGITERMYSGDFLHSTFRVQSSGQVNDDLVIFDKISIIADPFANKNFSHMLYAEYMGAKWKITGVETQYPRLILTIGGVYNGGSSGSSQHSM